MGGAVTALEPVLSRLYREQETVPTGICMYVSALPYIKVADVRKSQFNFIVMGPNSGLASLLICYNVINAQEYAVRTSIKEGVFRTFFV